MDEGNKDVALPPYENWATHFQSNFAHLWVENGVSVVSVCGKVEAWTRPFVLTDLASSPLCEECRAAWNSQKKTTP